MCFRFSIGVLSIVALVSCATAADKPAAQAAPQAQGIDAQILAGLNSASWADGRTAEIVQLFQTQFERCRALAPQSYQAVLAASANERLRLVIEEVDHFQVAGYQRAVAEGALLELTGRFVQREGEPLPDAQQQQRIAEQLAEVENDFREYAHAHQSRYGSETTEQLIGEHAGVLKDVSTDFFSPAFGKKLDDADLRFIRQALHDSVDDLKAVADASARQTDARFRTDAHSAVSKIDGDFNEALMRHFYAFAYGRDFPEDRQQAYAKWMGEIQPYQAAIAAGLERYQQVEMKASTKANEKDAGKSQQDNPSA